jgi:hypothetical protein
MRLVTWNCHHGSLVERAAELDRWRPDVLVLQECSGISSAGLWFPTTATKGIGVWAGQGYDVRPGTLSPLVTHSVFPVAVQGAERFHLLVVWAQRAPTYVTAMLEGIEAYADFMHEAPALVLGDFNSAPTLATAAARRDHAELWRRLVGDWGMLSAYHLSTGASPGTESPTYYHSFHRSAGFHLDYCFVPAAWATRIRSVRLAGPDEFVSSDHRPLLVELDTTEADGGVAG